VCILYSINKYTLYVNSVDNRCILGNPEVQYLDVVRADERKELAFADEELFQRDGVRQTCRRT
jgi:hypothetical protein